MFLIWCMNFCLLLKNSFKNAKKEQRKIHFKIADKGWIVQLAEMALMYNMPYKWPFVRFYRGPLVSALITL